VPHSDEVLRIEVFEGLNCLVATWKGAKVQWYRFQQEVVFDFNVRISILYAL
jgi:hypothetical protein